MYSGAVRTESEASREKVKHRRGRTVKNQPQCKDIAIENLRKQPRVNNNNKRKKEFSSQILLSA